MNVAIIHPYLSVRGGAETAAAIIIARFLARGHCVELWCIEPVVLVMAALKELAPEVNVARLTVRSSYLGWTRQLFKRPPALLGYSVLMRELRIRMLKNGPVPDLIFSTFGECDLQGAMGSAMYIHYPIFGRARDGAARLGGRLSRHGLLRTGYTFSCKILSGFRGLKPSATLMTNSAWTKSEIKRLVGRGDSRVVFGPVRAFEGVSLRPRAAFRNSSEVRVVCLGRLVSYKGQAMVAECVFLAASRSFRNASLLFVGRGHSDDERALREMSREGLTVEVETGASRSRIAELLENCDIGVSAFEFEHFGLAAAELFETGIPTLIPANGGQTEVPPDTRFIYSDAEALTQALSMLMGDPSHYKAICEAVRSQTGKFTIAGFIDRIDAALAHYEDY